MKDDNGVVVLLVIAGIVLAGFFWWLSQKLGVSMEVITRVAGYVTLVLVVYGAWSWYNNSEGKSNPWPFLFPSLWLASCPLIIAKGTTTPDFLVTHGVDQEFVWWATVWFRCLIFVVTAGLAAWLYWKPKR